MSHCMVVGAEVVLSGRGQWMVSEGTQTEECTSQVQITVPLQQVSHDSAAIAVWYNVARTVPDPNSLSSPHAHKESLG